MPDGIVLLAVDPDLAVEIGVAGLASVGRVLGRHDRLARAKSSVHRNRAGAGVLERHRQFMPRRECAPRRRRVIGARRKDRDGRPAPVRRGRNHLAEDIAFGQELRRRAQPFRTGRRRGERRARRKRQDGQGRSEHRAAREPAASMDPSADRQSLRRGYYAGQGANRSPRDERHGQGYHHRRPCRRHPCRLRRRGPRLQIARRRSRPRETGRG